MIVMSKAFREFLFRTRYNMDSEGDPFNYIYFTFKGQKRIGNSPN